MNGYRRITVLIVALVALISCFSNGGVLAVSSFAWIGAVRFDSVLRPKNGCCKTKWPRRTSIIHTTQTITLSSPLSLYAFIVILSKRQDPIKRWNQWVQATLRHPQLLSMQVLPQQQLVPPNSRCTSNFVPAEVCRGISWLSRISSNKNSPRYVFLFFHLYGLNPYRLIVGWFQVSHVSHHTI